MPRYGDMADLLGFLPQWAALLVLVVVTSMTVCMMGLALGKTGRSPYWALLIFFAPPLLMVGLWWCAYTTWPREKSSEKQSPPASP